MLKKIVSLLFCTVAPGALLAQQVELRSPDALISVEGEVVGFDGVMLSLETSVGQVSVPASDVICYGQACLALLANNSFGLTAEAFSGVIAAQEAVISQVPTTEQDVPDVAGADAFTISFDAPTFETLYLTIANAGQTTNDVELTATGQTFLQNAAGTATTTLDLESNITETDLSVGVISLNGPADVSFIGPSGWATAIQLPNQMLGLNAFVVIVAPNVGVDEISIVQLAGIYAGELTNWSQLGGSDLAILPLQMPENSPIHDEFMALVMEPAGKSIAGNVLTMANEVSIANSVSQFPGSVSIVTFSEAQENETMAVAGSCDITVEPAPFNIVSGDYPLLRPIMVTYGRAPETSLLAELFDSASSDVTQGLLEREGFINHSSLVQDAVPKNERLNRLLSTTLDDAQKLAAGEMFQTLFGADRLSPTMTGSAASGPEGAWSRAMMHNLAQLIQDEEFAGKELIFAGFGISNRGSQAAIDISGRAAAEVRSVFAEFASDTIATNNLTLESYGFGDVVPVACYGGQVEGDVSTRVEIWVR